MNHKKINNILYLADGGMFGGGQKITKSLYEHKKNNSLRKFMISIYNQRKEKDELKSRVCITNPYYFQSVGILNIFDIKNLVRIVKICKLWNIDIIHSDSNRTDIVAFIVFRFTRVKIVSTCHSYLVVGLRSRLLSIIKYFIYQYFDAVIAVSYFTKDYINKRTRVKLIKVVSCVIDLPEVSLKIEERQYNKFISLSPFILYVGRIIYEKGIEFLINAFQKMTSYEQYKNIKLIFVGDGPDIDKYKLIIKRRSQLNNIHFLGFMENLTELYSLCEFVVLPSMAETGSLVIKEAIMSGKAIIASNVGGIPEILQHRINGLLVRPHDTDGLVIAMRELLDNIALRENIERENILKSSCFKAKRMNENMEEIYEYLIAKQGI